MRFQVCAFLLTCRDVTVKSADEFHWLPDAVNAVNRSRGAQPRSDTAVFLPRRFDQLTRSFSASSRVAKTGNSRAEKWRTAS